MLRFSFPARLSPDLADGGFVVTFRDLKGAITQGNTVKEALSQAADCVEEYVAYRLREGLEIPAPSKPRRGEYQVSVPALMAAKAALWVAMRESGMSNSRLARQLGCDEKDIRRLLDPRHNSRITSLQKALGTLGKRIVVDVENAA
jgi:antitoxin HicB